MGIDLKAFLTFCSLLIALAAFLWNWLRTRKRLSYDYSSAPLMGPVKRNFRGRLGITLDGRYVENVSQVSVRIKNNGSVPIERKDVDTPISVTFEETARVLSVSVVNTVPKDLVIDVIDVAEAQREIELPPTLLNTNDEFTIAALVSDFNGNLEITGRIVGVKSIGRLNADRRWRDPVQRAAPGFLLAFCGAAYMIDHLAIHFLSQNYWPQIHFMTTVVVTSTLVSSLLALPKWR